MTTDSKKTTLVTQLQKQRPSVKVIIVFGFWFLSNLLVTTGFDQIASPLREKVYFLAPLIPVTFAIFMSALLFKNK